MNRYGIASASMVPVGVAPVGMASTGMAAFVQPRRPGVGVPTFSGMTPLAQPMAVDVHQRIAPMMDMRMGYASGGEVVDAGLDGLNAAQLLQFLVSIGKQRQAAPGQAASDTQVALGSDQEGGAAGNTAMGGAMSGNTPASMSGANYGPTAMGLDGLSPGRNALGSAGKLAGLVAGKAIPGAGFVSNIGNAFNGAVAGLQSQSAQDQVTGVQTGFMGSLGAAINGALGRDGQSLGGYAGAGLGGMAGLMSGMDPGVSGPARAMARGWADNVVATGNPNMSAAQMAGMPGFGIAGVSGPAASGFSDVGLGPTSAMAFGQGFTNTFGGVGNDGVASYGGTPAADFGGMDPNGPAAGQEGGQGGSGANGESQGGNANGGGGAGGGDSYARGGMAGNPRVRGIPGAKFRRGSGLVHGTSGGREDALAVEVPRGAYVIPADVVSGMGQGNTMAGAKALVGMMPPASELMLARGGIADAVEVPIRVSPGEFVIHPAHVDALGGAEALDRLVDEVRERNAAVAQGMPDPR